jgi:hypothetical protein
VSALDLCAVCLSAIWPSAKTLRQMPGVYYGNSVAVRIPGQPVRWGRPTIEEIEAGATVDVPGGVTLAMRAVTTVAGSRMCHCHAAEGLDQIEQRVSYR